MKLCMVETYVNSKGVWTLVVYVTYHLINHVESVLSSSRALLRLGTLVWKGSQFIPADLVCLEVVLNGRIDQLPFLIFLTYLCCITTDLCQSMTYLQTFVLCLRRSDFFFKYAQLPIWLQSSAIDQLNWLNFYVKWSFIGKFFQWRVAMVVSCFWQLYANW